jgi:hypothetical protein
MNGANQLGLGCLGKVSARDARQRHCPRPLVRNLSLIIPESEKH